MKSALQIYFRSTFLANNIALCTNLYLFCQIHVFAFRLCSVSLQFSLYSRFIAEEQKLILHLSERSLFLNVQPASRWEQKAVLSKARPGIVEASRLLHCFQFKHFLQFNVGSAFSLVIGFFPYASTYPHVHYNFSFRKKTWHMESHGTKCHKCHI